MPPMMVDGPCPDIRVEGFAAKPSFQAYPACVSRQGSTE